MYYGTCITYIQNPDMHTLAALDTLRITPRILGSVRAIAEAKGQEVLYQKQVPQALETLRQAALIQSTESSKFSFDAPGTVSPISFRRSR